MLSEKNKLSISMEKLRDDDIIDTITPTQNAKDALDVRMEVLGQNKSIFVHNLARIDPFLKGNMHYIMSKIIEHNKDNLVYSNTDSVVLTKRIKGEKFGEITIGENIGQLRYEGKSKRIIVESGILQKKKSEEFII